MARIQGGDIHVIDAESYRGEVPPSKDLVLHQLKCCLECFRRYSISHSSRDGRRLIIRYVEFDPETVHLASQLI